tara:strand:- start:93 stop:509 length:417 start_codon:yes stop_codon:yes gene_type:complete
MELSYTKLYENHHNIKIPKGFEIHHIDANRNNNNIDNLIMLPKEFHRALHNWVGLIPRDHIEKLLDWYKKQNRKFTPKALGYYLCAKFKRNNTDKKLEIACKKYLKERKYGQAVSLKINDVDTHYGVNITYGHNIYKI